MRKRLMMALAVAAAALPSCKKDDSGTSYAESVLLSKETINMKVGETAVLSARVYPQECDQNVYWASLDTSLVKVSKGGVVTSYDTGVTYVVATSPDGMAKASCLVSVNPPDHYNVIVKDTAGTQISSILSFPGLEMKLSASTSDTLSHILTWESTDTSVFTVEDGMVRLKYRQSADIHYLYYGSADLLVRSEDGFGVRIPVVSSVARSLWVNGELTAFGTYMAIQKKAVLTLGAAYYDGEEGGVMPPDRYTLISSDTENFTLEPGKEDYTLTAADADGIETVITLELPNAVQTAACTFAVEKYYGVTASLKASTSSTLCFTWTKGVSASEDVDAAYTVSLFSDAECTQTVKSFDFPQGCSAWAGKQPCFIIGRLDPSTKYWFKVWDTTNSLDSRVVDATTDAFVAVEMPASITANGIVLAEDFGELQWDFDFVNAAAGFFTTDQSNFANATVKEYRKNGASGETTFKGQSSALSKSTRLDGWVQDSYAYIHPGYLKLGIASARGWILTPEFTVPAGRKAIVRVTVTAARANTSQDTEWAVAVLTPEQAVATPGSHTANFSWPEIVSANYQEITLSGTSWQTVTVADLEVHSGGRIAFGGRKDGSSSKGRVLISDMIVEVTDIADE